MKDNQSNKIEPLKNTISCDSEIATEVALLLIEANILYYYKKDGRQYPYRWNSGLISPCYPDHRLILMYPKIRYKLIEYLSNLIQSLNLEYDCIASVESTGISFGCLLADRLNKPFCFVRKKTKGYGRDKLVECISGDININKTLIFDEVFSSGGHAIRSAIAIRKEIGSEVNHVIGITNNNLPYTLSNFNKFKLEPHVLTDLSFITKAAYISGNLTTEHAEDIYNFLSDPQNWAIKQKIIDNKNFKNYQSDLKIIL